MGLVANSRDLSLFDLLQVKGMARETCRITIGGRGHGTLGLRDGIVVHASFRELRGEQAAWAILAQSEVEYTVRSDLGGLDDNMREATQSLVMEASRQLDERGRGAVGGLSTPARSRLDRRCYAVIAAGAVGGVAAFFLVLALGRGGHLATPAQDGPATRAPASALSQGTGSLARPPSVH